MSTCAINACKILKEEKEEMKQQQQQNYLFPAFETYGHFEGFPTNLVKQFALMTQQQHQTMQKGFLPQHLYQNSQLIFQHQLMSFIGAKFFPERKSHLLKDQPVPTGYTRFRFNEDCQYEHWVYREHQTHFYSQRSRKVGYFYRGRFSAV